MTFTKETAVGLIRLFPNEERPIWVRVYFKIPEAREFMAGLGEHLRKMIEQPSGSGEAGAQAQTAASTNVIEVMTDRKADRLKQESAGAGHIREYFVEKPHADVLLVTATRIESRVVCDVFRPASGQDPKPTNIKDQTYQDLGVINGERVFLVQSEMGSSGVGGALLTVRKGIEALSASAVVMVGIAFGVDRTKHRIGDVLVSQQLMLYDLQRVGTEEGTVKIIPRGDRPHASSGLMSRFRSAHMHWDDAESKVWFGLILSGDKLVDNLDFRTQLQELEREAIGGEMEGAGLYVACQDAKVDWIVVKAICDWADGDKDADKEQRQHLAAHNAASFVLHMLQHASSGASSGVLPMA